MTSVLGGLDLAATVHAHLAFHRSASGPSVMTVGQLLGWVSSVVLLLVALACAWATVTALRHRPRSGP